jgi:hypothetical protein
MSTRGPLIFIATNRLKPGALAAERERVPELAAYHKDQEPRLIAYNENANDDRTEVTVVQVHPDAESRAVHLDVVRERAARAYAETLDATTSIQVYGAADPAMLAALRAQTGSGTSLSTKTLHVGGFTRSSARR